MVYTKEERVGLLYRKMLRSNEAGPFKGIVSEQFAEILTL
jgi:hypothetical protein